MDVWPMRNFYSCGCYTCDDVPVISRCGEHNGWVVSRTSFRVTNPRQLLVGDRLKVIHHNLYDVLEHLKRPLDLVFAYPEYDIFATSHQLSPLGWRTQRMEIFQHLLRLLKPDGQAVFVVDVVDLATVLYQAKLAGFETHNRFTPVQIKDEPLRFREEVYDGVVYKAVVGLNTGPLPRMRLKDLSSFFDELGVPDDARILDTSCIFLDAVQRARPNSKIVGIVEDASRYQRFLSASVVGTRPPAPHVRGGSEKKPKARTRKRIPD